MDVRTVVARCVRCYHEFSQAEIEGATACPNCGDKGVPMSPDDDVTIKINWHELRILVIWAENWANHIKDFPDVKPGTVETIWAIADRIQQQEGHGRAPLTLSGEFAEIKKQYPKSELIGVKEGGPLPPKVM